MPIVEGSDLLVDADDAEKQAARIGFPLLIKARAGGGGRGIRKVSDPSEVRAAYLAASSEAEAAFGDGGCYMERFIHPAHHVEVQILADQAGNVVSLGERECSVQRHNQKLLEESPSPSITQEVREHMHEAARNLARAVGYVGVGTIEYLYSDDGTFAFMEMNTRLQVEHPVTEMVTGLDLVKWHLRVAFCAELPFTQDDVHVSGHAIECRINAETPEFLPSCGRINTLHVPGGPWVRFDTALFQGAEVPPFYDSMLGKLIVSSPSREGSSAKCVLPLVSL